MIKNTQKTNNFLEIGDIKYLENTNDLNLLLTEEKQMEELINYNIEYHHLMKEIFIFNRMWNDKKLFFTDNHLIKYKNINYYTRNYQRPIIFPVFDYKK